MAEPDYAGVAASAGRALSGIGDFIYRNQIQKPLLQAETRGANAQADIASVTAKSAQREWAKQNMVLDPTKLAGITEDGSTPPSSNPAPQTPGAAPAVTPGPAAAPSAPPPPQLPSFTVPPPVTPPAPFLGSSNTNVNTPVGDSVVPGSISSPVLPNTKPSPNLGSTAGSPSSPSLPADFGSRLDDLARSSGPGAPASTTASTTTLPPAQPAPSVTAPSTATTPAAAVSQATPFDPSDLLTRPFYTLPKAAQTEILRQGREQMKAAGFKISDQELVQQFAENQAKAYPPINPYTAGNLGLVVKEIGPTGATYLNPRLAAQMGGGSSGPQPFIIGPDGSTQKNPAYLTPELVAQKRGALSTTQAGLSLLDNAADVLDKHPEAYGQNLASGHLGGTAAGRIAAQIEAKAGDAGTYDAQRTLEMEQLKGVLDTLGQVHIGRVTEKEWGAMANSIPKLTDDKATWTGWMSRVRGLLQSDAGYLQGDLAPYYGAQLQPQLPPVDLSGQRIQPPQAGAAGSNGPVSLDGMSAKDAQAAAAAAKRAGKAISLKGTVYQP